MKTMEAFPLRDRVGERPFSYVMYLWKFNLAGAPSVFYAPEGSRLTVWQRLCAWHS